VILSSFAPIQMDQQPGSVGGVFDRIEAMLPASEQAQDNRTDVPSRSPNVAAK
jgi:hypothetical protein